MAASKRMIHGKIWHDESFASLKLTRRLLYIGMITIADDEGRLSGGGRFLKSFILPYDKIGVRQVEKMRDEIWKAGLIDLYSTEKGICIAHPNWNKYQKLDKRLSKPSDFPPPPPRDAQETTCESPAQVKVGEGKGSQDNEGEGKASSAATANVFTLHKEQMLAGMSSVSPNLAREYSVRPDHSSEESAQTG